MATPTDPPPITQTVELNFKMSDPEGTAPVRVVAGHAIRVGESWVSLGKQMMELADGFDALVSGANQDPS